MLTSIWHPTINTLVPNHFVSDPILRNEQPEYGVDALYTAVPDERAYLTTNVHADGQPHASPVPVVLGLVRFFLVKNKPNFRLGDALAVVLDFKHYLLGG